MGVSRQLYHENMSKPYVERSSNLVKEFANVNEVVFAQRTEWRT